MQISGTTSHLVKWKNLKHISGFNAKRACIRINPCSTDCSPNTIDCKKTNLLNEECSGKLGFSFIPISRQPMSKLFYHRKNSHICPEEDWPSRRSTVWTELKLIIAFLNVNSPVNAKQLILSELSAIDHLLVHRGFLLNNLSVRWNFREFLS